MRISAKYRLAREKGKVATNNLESEAVTNR